MIETNSTFYLLRRTLILLKRIIIMEIPYHTQVCQMVNYPLCFLSSKWRNNGTHISYLLCGKRKFQRSRNMDIGNQKSIQRSNIQLLLEMIKQKYSYIKNSFIFIHFNLENNIYFTINERIEVQSQFHQNVLIKILYIENMLLLKDFNVLKYTSTSYWTKTRSDITIIFSSFSFFSHQIIVYFHTFCDLVKTVVRDLFRPTWKLCTHMETSNLPIKDF